MPTKHAPTAEEIDKIIRNSLSRLRKPGVLTVRPGYEIANHQLTGRSAAVATVHTKLKTLPRKDMLPNYLGGVAVDVREATAHQRLRAHDPVAAALTQAYGRPENIEPAWPFEREMPSGKLLDDPASSTQQQFAQHRARQPATDRALAAHKSKPEIPYQPAAGVSLSPVTIKTTITAAVSPDAGLTTLQKFLVGTRHSLTIGMYDFTSGEILKMVLNDLAPSKTLQMVLDNPAPNATRDQTDTQTVNELGQQLGGRAKIMRALVRSDPFAAEWMFPYAYHIKVIIRDGSAFWLSSGNLNNSNEPDLSSPPQYEDRDWHVIIEDAGLAKTFGAFLNQDFASATQHQASQPQLLAAAVADAHARLAAEAIPAPPAAAPAAKHIGNVPAQVFKDVNVTITPLLTPDRLPGGSQKGQYLTNIVELIAGAKHTLYIQLQYIESSKGDGGDYDTLLRAIATRVAAGVDVRLIESTEYGLNWAEKMKAAGVDLTANIRLQHHVHNKGFVVDSRKAVVSSQNFSPAGIDENRDAGVIIEHPGVAQYFEKIFVADWNNAKPVVASPSKQHGSGKKAQQRTRSGRRPAA